MARRWRPPPMNDGDAQPESKAEQPKVTVDEKVVRKMLQINPALRDGRTTFQVKKDMEGGQAVRATDGPSTGPVPGEAQAAAVQGSAGGAAASAPKSSGAKGELEDTIGFFIRGKAEGFDGQLTEIAERRRALDEEEQALKAQLGGQMASFLSMLDETIVAMHGVSVLSRHKDFLSRLGLDPAKLLEMARQARK